MKTKLFRHKKMVAALALTGLFSSAAYAAGTNSSFNVGITIDGACTIDSVDSVNFGTFTIGTSTSLSDTGTVAVTCPNNVPYSLGINGGTNLSGTDRRMRYNTTSYYITYTVTDTSDVSWGTQGMSASHSYPAAPKTATGDGTSTPYTYKVSTTLAGSEIAASYSDTVTVYLQW